ncbi:unnamed protein product [Prunus armeniaca]
MEESCTRKAVTGALKNTDWDPLLPKASKGKKALAVLSRPSTPAAAVPRVAAPPLARAAIVTSIAAPTSRAPVVVWARKTLAHRTVPSAPPTRPIAAVALGRKRGQEASSTEAAAVEAAPAESVVVETAMLERSRKRVLLVLSEGEDEEEVPPVIMSEAPLVTGEAVAENLVEEVAAAEVAVEGAATAEVAEMLDAEATVAEVPAIEEAAVDMPDDEVLAVERTRAASAMPTLTVTASVEPLRFTPHRPSGIVIRSKTTSSDDLEELYASLHEEGGSSASAPLDEDSKAVIERLREFLFFGVHQMTTAEAFMEFGSCLDTVMALGCWTRLSWMGYRLAWPRARR